ncbi:MAG: vanadium nitrogenase [Eubacterium sp.]|nr:vanadium nitrogenase [Eubacterium sp.]
MAAIFGAFIQYVLTLIFYVIVAGAGIFAGKALLKKKKEKDALEASEK